jgi:thiol peroxidase
MDIGRNEHTFRPETKEREKFMIVQEGAVTLRGKRLTLLGSQVEPGKPAPGFIAVDQDFAPVAFSSFRGKPCIICSLLSLDTQVCDAVIRRFDEEASQVSPDFQIIVISMDLPFAQKRRHPGEGFERVTVVSDHHDGSFGTAYGVLIKELRLLAPAVFIVDREGILRYKEVASEVTDEPDYERALEAAREMV